MNRSITVAPFQQTAFDAKAEQMDPILNWHTGAIGYLGPRLVFLRENGDVSDITPRAALVKLAAVSTLEVADSSADFTAVAKFLTDVADMIP